MDNSLYIINRSINGNISDAWIIMNCEECFGASFGDCQRCPILTNGGIDMGLNKNGSGCYDPTACAAISKADKDKARLTKVVDTIRNICDLAGFKIEGRIVLVDKKTGKVWR